VGHDRAGACAAALAATKHVRSNVAALNPRRAREGPVLVSKAFADVEGMRGRLVSVGRYALRGLAEPQELFTLDYRQADGAERSF
jgi:hypothetical protein